MVGSGPAGLAAADQLNRRGHLVTVVERAECPGGLLMYGIPNMKLPKSVVRRRIDLMSEEGVTFVCGVDAAERAVAKRLLAEYDAVILCCGAGEPRPLGLDTAGVTGVCCGTEYLKSAVERAQLGREETAAPSAAGLDVVIVGTGDTASDCVATALRQGCRSAPSWSAGRGRTIWTARERSRWTTPTRRLWPSPGRTPGAFPSRSSVL